MGSDVGQVADFSYREARSSWGLLENMMKLVWMVLLCLGWMGCQDTTAIAGSLQARLEQFPNWRSPPMLQPAKGDLYYPDWFTGRWQVTSTLVDLVAPLAPDIVTPGFAANQKTLNQPITFPVQFGPEPFKISALPQLPFPVGQLLPSQGIVADRVYNGMSLADALLGKAVLKSIKVDPQSPNRQVALFQNGQTLVTRISDRATQAPSDDNFVSSELYQQEFRSSTQIYFNQVENTIDYHHVSSEPPRIEADQVTVIYLSPQDPDYFKAKDHPVTLYRYRLQFLPS